jgi:hypothetical protein
MMPGKIGSGVAIAWASYSCAAACITPDATGRARTGNGSHASPGPNPPSGPLELGGVDNAQGRQYDVAPDGRFLIATVLDNSATAPITLLTNWNPGAKK